MATSVCWTRPVSSLTLTLGPNVTGAMFKGPSSPASLPASGFASCAASRSAAMPSEALAPSIGTTGPLASTALASTLLAGAPASGVWLVVPESGAVCPPVGNPVFVGCPVGRAPSVCPGGTAGADELFSEEHAVAQTTIATKTYRKPHLDMTVSSFD
ncbi:MAG: hypothetical protein JXA30_15085 [Deltaproteobacteria bacterium]|nr:hypothetical protein [Deltaproteobacteria bacterium]